MNHLALRKAIAILLMALLIFTTAACNGSKSRIEGTYTNSLGTATLDLRSGGKAAFTMMGESFTCTYKVEGNKLTLDCKQDEPVVFTIHDDGSLTPQGGFIGTMKKSK